MDYASTSSTGASLSLLGVAVDQTWLVAAGLGIVAAGALAARFLFRSGKSIDQV